MYTCNYNDGLTVLGGKDTKQPHLPKSCSVLSCQWRGPLGAHTSNHSGHSQGLHKSEYIYNYAAINVFLSYPFPFLI